MVTRLPYAGATIFFSGWICTARAMHVEQAEDYHMPESTIKVLETLILLINFNNSKYPDKPIIFDTLGFITE